MGIKISFLLNQIWLVLRGFTILTALFLLGEWLAGFLPLPIPGAVIGMVVVFVLLQVSVLPLRWVDQTSVWLLTFLGLFYVPYGVGIIESGQLIEKWGIQIMFIMVVTALTGFIVTGWIFQILYNYKSGIDE